MHQEKPRTVAMANKRANCSNNQGGFTLVETVVVVAVIAVVLAGAVISTRSVLPGYRADSGMNQVVSELRSARLRAISQRHEVQVQFVGTNKIVVTDIVLKGVAPPPVNINFEGGAQFALVPALPDTPMALGGGTPTAPPIAAVYFGGIPGGPPIMKFTTTGAFIDANSNFVDGTVFLSLNNQPNTARAVTVLGATGRVRPYHYDGTNWQE